MQTFSVQDEKEVKEILTLKSEYYDLTPTEKMRLIQSILTWSAEQLFEIQDNVSYDYAQLLHKVENQSRDNGQSIATEN